MLVRLQAVAMLAATLGAAGAAPTPIPGGANQVSAVSSPLGKTVFNGMLRVKITGLRAGNAAEVASVKPTADQKVMYVESLLTNGTNDDFVSFVT